MATSLSSWLCAWRFEFYEQCHKQKCTHDSSLKLLQHLLDLINVNWCQKQMIVNDSTFNHQFVNDLWEDYFLEGAWSIQWQKHCVRSLTSTLEPSLPDLPHVPQPRYVRHASGFDGRREYNTHHYYWQQKRSPETQDSVHISNQTFSTESIPNIQNHVTPCIFKPKRQRGRSENTTKSCERKSLTVYDIVRQSCSQPLTAFHETRTSTTDAFAFSDSSSIETSIQKSSMSITKACESSTKLHTCSKHDAGVTTSYSNDDMMQSWGTPDHCLLNSDDIINVYQDHGVNDNRCREIMFDYHKKRLLQTWWTVDFLNNLRSSVRKAHTRTTYMNHQNRHNFITNMSEDYIFDFFDDTHATNYMYHIINVINGDVKRFESMHLNIYLTLCMIYIQMQSCYYIHQHFCSRTKIAKSHDHHSILNALDLHTSMPQKIKTHPRFGKHGKKHKHNTTQIMINTVLKLVDEFFIHKNYKYHRWLYECWTCLDQNQSIHVNSRVLEHDQSYFLGLYLIDNNDKSNKHLEYLKMYDDEKISIMDNCFEFGKRALLCVLNEMNTLHFHWIDLHKNGDHWLWQIQWPFTKKTFDNASDARSQRTTRGETNRKLTHDYRTCVGNISPPPFSYRQKSQHYLGTRESFLKCQLIQ